MELFYANTLLIHVYKPGVDREELSRTMKTEIPIRLALPFSPFPLFERIH